MKHEYELDATQVAGMKDGAATARMDREVSEAVGSGLRIMSQHHKRKEVRRGGGAPVSNRWTTRTGEAVRSFHIDWRRGDLAGGYGSDLHRVKALEEGATIRPKRSQFLTIPTAAAKHGVGPSGSPRDYPGLFFFTSRRGQPLLGRKGSGGGLEVMFILKRQVKLEPRETLKRTMKEKAEEVERKVADAAERGYGDAPAG